MTLHSKTCSIKYIERKHELLQHDNNENWVRNKKPEKWNMYKWATQHDTDANDNMYACVTLHSSDVNDDMHDCVTPHDAHSTEHIH